MPPENACSLYATFFGDSDFNFYAARQIELPGECRHVRLHQVLGGAFLYDSGGLSANLKCADEYRDREGDYRCLSAYHEHSLGGRLRQRTLVLGTGGANVGLSAAALATRVPHAKNAGGSIRLDRPAQSKMIDLEL